ncbi:NAD(P)/FAD-dependent oxidoreductase [Marinicella sp. W31]|uniref:NAD(P)/FAD-dependent oxidoreductase n=1 Tax=Marinicella sp. W31 TaxID=3023713 RepID=UPI003757CB78
MKAYDVIVLGAGAAGLMCAFTAGRHGKKVLVIERANKVGKKILMSGGGRCNFTNLYIEPQRYLSANPHFFKSALKQYTQWDFIAMVKQHGIDYHEKEEGQLFCNKSSKQIVNMLLDECSDAQVEVMTMCEVEAVKKTPEGFELKTSQGAFNATDLVVATGGLSIPKMGGSGFGYELAEQFGLTVLPRSAGLVPFTFTDDYKTLFSSLSGASVVAEASVGKQAFYNNILFTHRGLSGPAILQISSYWQPGDWLHLNLAPEQDISEQLLECKQQQPNLKWGQFLQKLWPKNVAHAFMAQETPDITEDRALHSINDKICRRLGQLLNDWRLKPAATEGYRTAEVTLGGVNTDHLSSQTMVCKSVPGLYFIGEVVDVTGHLGGFNFQWAWSSGYVAGQAIGSQKI